MIRLAYVLDTITTGSAGTEGQLLAMLGRIDRARFDPTLVVLRDSEWVQENRPWLPIEVIALRRLAGFDFWRQGRRFARFCRERRIDVVQSFFHDAGILATYWGHRARVPAIVASRRSMGRGYWHYPAYLMLLRYLRRWTSHYLANSSAAASEAIECERLDPARVTVIPNGLDISRFKGIEDSERGRIRDEWGFSPDDIVVGAVANLRPVKNHPFLIDAAAELIGQNPRIRVVIVGEGDQRPELESLIADHGLQSKIVLPGRSLRVEKDLAALDIAVLCSHGESLSNSLIEYLAAGRPTVASDVGGNSEIVADGVDGYLFPPGDRGRFISLVRRLVDDPKVRVEMGSRGSEKVAREYSFERAVWSHQDLYQRLVGARNCGVAASKKVPA